MRKRDFGLLATVILQTCVLVSQTGSQKPSGFYFNGKEFHLGMSEREALAELSDCCKLSPPPSLSDDSTTTDSGQTKGYYVLSKQQGNQSVLGGIWFKGQKVVSLSRDLSSNFDTYSDDLVTFMRTFERSLPEGATPAVIGVQHDQATNGESDSVTIQLTDSRRIQIRIVTLDKSVSAKRDFVTIEEILGSTD